MNYALACQAINVAGTLGLNDGSFAFIMFDLDLDLTGNTKKNLSVTWAKDWNEEAFHSALVLSVNNKVGVEYSVFIEDVKRRNSGPPLYYPSHLGYTVSVSSYSSPSMSSRSSKFKMAAQRRCWQMADHLSDPIDVSRSVICQAFFRVASLITETTLGARCVKVNKVQ